MPSFPKDHPKSHNACRNPEHTEFLCCCQGMIGCYWEIIGGSSFTQPLGMSGEEKWWDTIKYSSLIHPEDGTPIKVYDIPAIIAEAEKRERKRVLTSVRKMIEGMKQETKRQEMERRYPLTYVSFSYASEEEKYADIQKYMTNAAIAEVLNSLDKME